ncbi:putative uncharacterized protein [Bacteroides sp. CAG:462]|nr:putative uncharacterized protein [Bacteroides sp. CAG:462]
MNRNMRTYIKGLLAVACAAGFASCEDFKDANRAETVAPIEVSVNLTLDVTNVASTENFTVRFDNYDEDLHIAEEFDGIDAISVDGIIPGIYTVTVSGTVYNEEGDEYTVNGNIVNKAIYQSGTSLDITVQGLRVSPLLLKEIYYAGSRTPAGGVYFRDQFYEIYNNSEETEYLDGIYFANLTPGKSSTTLPVWPESDGNNYAYAERVWRIPGNGTDYPLAPGESCVISQFAANHQLQIYNPNSPIDGSVSEFEFNMNNASFPDQPAVDMVHVFYEGKADMGSIPQYLTSVFGPAIVIFKVPKGESYDPVNDPNLSTIDLSKPGSDTYYAKIPIGYVLDAVECIDNAAAIDAKRVPGVLDAGVTYVGSTYCGLGVARKPQTDENGEYVYNAAGALLFRDTNNSTDDFEGGVVPMIRRYGTGMPAWNHTLQ